ncbi:SGNH/GDSL hydrolase family protein [Acetobacter sp. TBRC 12305]|uniref:SGNH/GDSL hydrolase family protein n=1 Tax=Acetobacter garciniae TaxID=2817435 RepID=UPI001C72B8E2|nr:SGNH/GDSL hydrolase family protein [Acetobacter garciniae]MBX0345076.1 SGNH/GDSL hydrolase family protein [Acetobacter garciniae]
MKQTLRVMCSLCCLGGVLPAAHGIMPMARAATCAQASPPGPTDDAGQGYKADDLWQACGTVWRAISVRAGAAVWQNVPEPGLPADAFGQHTLFAGGTVRMVSGYTGPALDVSLTSQGVPSTQTLNITASGQLDTTPLRQRDPGTYALVTRVYDQSGHGNHLLATPGKAVVHVGEVRVGDAEALSWGEANGPGGFVLPPTLNVDARSFFFGTTGAYASSNSGYAAYPVPLLLGQGGAGHEAKVYFGGYELDGFVHVADSASLDQRLDLVVTNSPASFSLWAHDGTYHVQSGNAQALGRSRITPPTLAGGYIGFNADGGPWFSQGRNTGLWTGLVLADHVSDPEAVVRFRAAAAAQGQYAPQLRTALVALGDSRTEGYLVADGQNWPRLAQANGQYQSYNLAVSGATTRHMLGMLPAAATIARHAGPRVAVVFGGYNDHLGPNGIGYDETLANLRHIVQGLHDLKYRVVLVAEAPTDPVLRGKVLAALATGDLHPDTVVDPFAAGLPLSNLGNTLYWNSDVTHPTVAGQAELARLLWPAIGAALAPGAAQGVSPDAPGAYQPVQGGPP